MRNRWDEAELKARAALAEDPTFASASVLLAWALRNDGKARKEYLPFAERAVALSEYGTERERHFILGSFYTLSGQDEKALGSFEALVEIDPDYFLALSRLANTYARLQRWREGAGYMARHADLHPNNVMANYSATRALATWMGDPTRALPYARRALAILKVDGDPFLQKLRAWFQVLPAFERWMDGDMEGAVSQISALVEQTKTPSGDVEYQVARNAGFFYIGLGRLRAAEELFTLIDDSGEGFLPLVNFIRGKSPVVRQFPRNFGSTNAMIFAKHGLESEARRIVDTLKGNSEDFLAMPAGVIAGRHGQTPQAISLLERGMAASQFFVWAHSYLGAEALADIWWRQGASDKALAVLDLASQNKMHSYGDVPVFYFWMRTEAQRADYLRRLGRLDEAQRIESGLLTLLTQADADFPLLVELKARQQAIVPRQAPPPS